MIQYPTIKPEIRSEFTIFSTFRILLNHSDMRTALKISLIYLGCCSTYILFSDQIIARLFTSPQELTFIQSIKGITFVIGSSILIYVLVRYYISKSLDAEKRSEDVSEYYRLVFENNPLPCFIVDIKTLNYLKVNRAATAKFELSEQEFMKLRISDIVGNFNEKEIKEWLQDVKNSDYFETQIDGLQEAGEVINTQVFCQYIKYDDKDCIFIVALDISETRNPDQAYMDSIIDILESVKSNLSREIHDGIKQHFGLIKGLLTSHNQDNQPSKYIDKAIESANLGLEESRRISHFLAPGFEGFNLKESIKHLVENVNLMSKIHFTFKMNIHEEYSDEVSLNIYRIIQEASSNIISHSEASQATIEIVEKNGYLNLIITDNGIGFKKHFSSNSLKSIGMKTMRSRATKMKGYINIYSQPGKGTNIKVKVPVAA